MITKKLIFLILIGSVVICSFRGNLYAQNKEGSDKALTAKQQSIIPIAAYTAQGELQRLKPALNEGLDAGLTINEIKEVIVHLYAYCGFPRSIRGLQTFMEVLDERKAKGITDKPGAEASPVNDERSKYERGRENLEKLIGMPLNETKKGYAAFAPVIEIFLKEHLFADIFERDILTFAERELVTVSVLSSIGGVEPMLRSHLSICLNVGLTPEQLNEFVDIIKSTGGEKEAKEAQKVLNEVLKSALDLTSFGNLTSPDDEIKQKEEFNFDDMMIRMAEIEVDSNYLEEYIRILKEESAASVRLEPGVVCIYPMYQKENPTAIRLLEIYANKEAYESHLQTPHFKHYKTATLKMVRSLKLIDMEAIDKGTMPTIFTKLGQYEKN